MSIAVPAKPVEVLVRGEKPADDGRPAFRLRDVTHTYPRGVRALDGVSITIPAGQHTVIVGPSGSGKTTLLACLAGRLTPSVGMVERTGAIATIYQDLRLVPERSVLGNVLDGALGRCGLWRSAVGMSAEDRREAMALIERVGLRERARMPVGKLSGGEQQRVAIARALMQRPSVILADEPVCALDRDHAESVLELFRTVCAERGVTLVSVLHDESLAAKYADHRFCLHAGRAVGALHKPGCGHDAGSSGAVALPARAACVACESHHGEGERCLGTQAAGATAPVEHQRPAWMHPFALLGVGLLAIFAYVWSVASLGLHETSGRSAVYGLGAFLSAIIPGSLAELAAIPWGRLLRALVETLQMSLIGTTVGVAIAYPLSALAARNTGPRVVRSVVRQTLNAIRTVPALIWALLFVAAVGFGTLAGVLALSLYSVGYLTKFFYESFENAPNGPQAALKEIGASGPQRFLRAVAPATRPAAIASAMFMLEYNVRSASVLGIVDAGGIGYDIKFYLDMRQFPAALACLVLIFGVVVLLDALSVRMRRRLLAE